MSEKRMFFKVIPDGFTEKVIIDFKSKYHNVTDSWFSFSKKYGGNSVWADRSVKGIVFDDNNAPEGWNTNRNLPRNCYKPIRKKICMGAYREFLALERRPSNFQLKNSLKIGDVMDGMSIYFPSFEEIGDIMILSLHKESELPDGVEPLKMSEYWELKESIQLILKKDKE